MATTGSDFAGLAAGVSATLAVRFDAGFAVGFDAAFAVGVAGAFAVGFDLPGAFAGFDLLRAGAGLLTIGLAGVAFFPRALVAFVALLGAAVFDDAVFLDFTVAFDLAEGVALGTGFFTTALAGAGFLPFGAADLAAGFGLDFADDFAVSAGFRPFFPTAVPPPAAGLADRDFVAEGLLLV